MARGERPGCRDALCGDELHDDESVGRKTRDAHSNSGVRETGRGTSADVNADARHHGDIAAESDADTAACSSGGPRSRHGDPGPPDRDAPPRCHGSSSGGAPCRDRRATDRDPRASLGDASASDRDAASGYCYASAGKGRSGPGDGDASTADRDGGARDSRTSDPDADSDSADTDPDKAVYSGQADAHPQARRLLRR